MRNIYFDKDAKLLGMRLKYGKIVLIFCALLAVSLFLPFLSGDGRITLSIALFIKGFTALSGGKLFFTATAFFVQIAAIVVTLLSVFVWKNKRSFCVTTWLYALSCVLMTAFLFTAKNIIDGSNLFGAPFMVKNLGIGYWCLLVFDFCALFFAMKTVKISTEYILLTILSVVWLLPILFILLTSLRAEQGYYMPYILPKHFTLKNYASLFTDSSVFQYGKWFGNTIFVSICSCVVSTLIVISTAYVFSRIDFRQKKTLMSGFLILGMFPGFMSMIAIYYIIKWIGLSQSLLALIMVYSGGSALGYYIVKGFFDTVPKSLEEAAYIDGATKGQVFLKIIMPLSKPIVIYVILTSFMQPWGDYIFAQTILGDKTESYTVAIGLYKMLEPTYIEGWYTRFAAGSVLVALPATILFVSLQKYYVQGLTGAVKG